MPPALTALGVIAATLYVRAVDPNVPGHYPPCPTKLLFGIDCPGCGGLRATHALANGDIAAAADHNVLVLVAIPVAIVLWVMWVRRSWRGPGSDSIGEPVPTAIARGRWHRAVMPAVLVLLAAYTVVRNLVPYLGSGIG